MVFLRSPLMVDPGPYIRGDQVLLRPPQPADYARWAELRAESRDHLVPWEPEWSRDELSRSAYRRRLRLYAHEQREDLGYAFFIFTPGEDVLLGGLTISNVRRGVTQAATLGYWTGLRFARRGVMTRAVSAAMRFAFEELRLHRIDAACLPENVGSRRVLERNGFALEGLARQYLKINGQWRDHLIFALIEGDRRGNQGVKV